MILNKSDVFFGFNMPFNGGPQNILSRQSDDKLIKNDILQLLLTIPGERVMRPNFGVPLRSFLFEKMTQNDFLALEDAIIEALKNQEPRVSIDTVSVSSNNDRNGIDVKVVVRLIKDPKKVLTIEQFFSQGV